MKKRTMKLVKVVSVLLLFVVGAIGLVACNNSSKVKIGVLAADVSGAEAMSFRSYYEKYVAEQYEVEFVYSTQLDDAADEMSALETFAAENCKAIISFSSYDRPGQIDKCTEYKMYYVVATGMLSEIDFAKYKSYEYFLGQIGPDTLEEYNVGLEMGKFYKAKNVKNVALYVGFPDPSHVARLAGILTGLGMSYAGMNVVPDQAPTVDLANPVQGLAIMDSIYALNGGTATIGNIVTGNSGITITQVLSGAGFNGPLDAQVTKLTSGDKPDVVLGVGMVSAFFASQLDTAGIAYSDVDAFTSTNKEHFEEGKMEYLTGKYGSTVGPVFALVYNAINGNVIRDNGNAISLSQSYLVATSKAEFDAAYAKETGDSPIFNKTVLDTVIGEGITYDQFKAFVEAER